MASTGILERHGAKCDEVGEATILDWRAGGATTREIRRKLGIMHDGTPVGDGTGGGVRGLYKWLHQTPERWAAWQEAGRQAAEGLNDEALEIADDGDEETVQRDRLRVDQRRYMAERLDPATFAKPNASVVVNLGGLHLHAVRSVQEELHAERDKLRLGSGATLQLSGVEGVGTASPHTHTVKDVAPAATSGLVDSPAIQYATLLD